MGVDILGHHQIIKTKMELLFRGDLIRNKVVLVAVRVINLYYTPMDSIFLEVKTLKSKIRLVQQLSLELVKIIKKF